MAPRRRNIFQGKLDPPCPLQAKQPAYMSLPLQVTGSSTTTVGFLRNCVTVSYTYRYSHNEGCYFNNYSAQLTVATFPVVLKLRSFAQCSLIIPNFLSTGNFARQSDLGGEQIAAANCVQNALN